MGEVIEGGFNNILRNSFFNFRVDNAPKRLSSSISAFMSAKQETKEKNDRSFVVSVVKAVVSLVVIMNYGVSIR